MKQLTRINKSDRPVKILQFGEGNFLRAFVDNFFQVLNEKELFNGSICVVQPLSFGRVKDLEEQGGLYTLYLEGINKGKVVKEHQIIDVLTDFINPYEQLDKYLEYARSKDLEYIISNTTEAGIVYEEELISKTKTPNSFPAKLLLFLHERFNHFKGSKEAGLEIIPCELIDDNGTKLLEILVKLAEFNKLSDEFIKWLKEDNYYFNTLVDRIVPGYPRDEIDEITKELGYIDHSIVKGEIFHLWVLDNDQGYRSKLEQPFKKSGLEVFFVDSIKPYKERKVKILNGTHTAMVPVSYLIGHEAVKESMEDPIILEFVKSLVYEEIIPTIELSFNDMDKFAKSVFERYLNPFVHHLLMSISLNSVSKYKSRILPTVLGQEKLGHFPKHALFSLAALIRFYKGVDEKGAKINLSDDKEFLALFKKLWETNDLDLIVSKFLSLDFWETTYLQKPEVIKFVTKYLKVMNDEGMLVALKQLLGEK